MVELAERTEEPMVMNGVVAVIMGLAILDGAKSMVLKLRVAPKALLEVGQRYGLMHAVVERPFA